MNNEQSRAAEIVGYIYKGNIILLFTYYTYMCVYIFVYIYVCVSDTCVYTYIVYCISVHIISLLQASVKGRIFVMGVWKIFEQIIYH